MHPHCFFRFTILLLVSMFFVRFSAAALLHVPADYATIQAGIDCAQDGDTVLVSPGTWFENLDFYGKSIVVTSCCIISQDTSMIHSTILDGSGKAPVVTFADGEDSTTILQGFVIKNGRETRINDTGRGGGILCFKAKPLLQDLVIRENAGAGLYADSADVVLRNCSVVDNTGMGIYLHDSRATITNCKVSSNSNGGLSCTGSAVDIIKTVITGNGAMNSAIGGIRCTWESDLKLAGVTISENQSVQGGGITCISSAVLFDPVCLCNIYSNRAMHGGQDLDSDVPIEVTVDTFTVLKPTENEAHPLSKFTFQIRHGYFPDEPRDLFVSPDGSDLGSGLTPGDPLKTLALAMHKVRPRPDHPCVIHLAEGRYGPDYNGDIFPVRIKSHAYIIGVSRKSTILDGCGKTRIFYCGGIQNVHFEQLSIQNGRDAVGGGILAGDAHIAMTSCEIIMCESSSQGGGGIYIYGVSTGLLADVVLTDNRCQNEAVLSGGGGAICIDQGASVTLDHCVIADNRSEYGGGFACKAAGKVRVLNSVIVKNHALKNGGGAYFSNARGELQNCTLARNQGDKLGGGIYLNSSYLALKSGSIAHNRTLYNYLCEGGGVYCQKSTLEFDTVERASIHDNSSFKGQDVFTDTRIKVVVDTFTVSTPTDYFLSPVSFFTWNVLRAVHEQIYGDIFVDAGSGNDQNSGRTMEEPLKTLHRAFTKITADSLNPGIIHLADGLYSAGSNGEAFPICGVNYVEIRGGHTAGTILDAEYTSSLVDCRDVRNFSLANMTLQRGEQNFGNGLVIENSSVQFRDVTISATKADGIYCYRSVLKMAGVLVTGSANHGLNLGQGSAEIEDSIFESNGKDGIHADQSVIAAKQIDCRKNGSCGIRGERSTRISIDSGSFVENGNGLVSYDGVILLRNSVSARNKTMANGAGIQLYRSKADMYHTSIFENTGARGGGIYCDDQSELVFGDQANSIYNNHAQIGCDVYSSGKKFSAIVLDSFTVDRPTNFYIVPVVPGSFTITHPLRRLQNADFFVSADGSDANTGLSSSSPLRSVYQALSRIYADSTHPCAIHLANGTYSPSLTGEHFPLPAVDYISISGDDWAETILDAEKTGPGILIENCTQFILEALTLCNGYSSSYGGVVISRSTPRLQNMAIHHIHGIGIYCIDSAPRLDRVMLTDGYNTENFRSGHSGAFTSIFSNPVLINVTMANNRYSSYGYRWVEGGAFYADHTKAVIINSIISDNSIFDMMTQDSCEIVVVSSLLERGKDKIQKLAELNLVWLEGNQSGDPGMNPDYSLSANSPCIDVGIIEFVWQGDTLLQRPVDSYYGPAPDLGALEYTGSAGISMDVEQPLEYALLQNYPNPFNPLTTIEFTLPKPETVHLCVYSVLGAEVTELAAGPLPAGSHKLFWNADCCGSGVYFIRLEAGPYHAIRKAIVMK